MSRNKYKKITFAKGYNKSLADFKKEFENDFHFSGLKGKARGNEMEKAWKAATKGNKPKKVKKAKKQTTDEFSAGDEKLGKLDKGKHSE